ncbi:hypothetical protein Vafri_11071 [Volvox africanus]|uniref:Carbohydrate kinase PfkB domain-containing protein n=1 Tax=Volvox africanus TaxID=51714 RepID=A0A8J4F1B2_9CHLO|nr:hypothetical protein Vafri_11071 [Volvox africanus]
MWDVIPHPRTHGPTDQTQGGGNCANALTAAARLGLAPTLVTKIGADGLGDGIISELHRDGIDTTHVLRAKGHPSPFTYIIVDRQGGTRTCIHTPGATLEPYEMDEQRISSVLEGASLVYFDGRLTEAAVPLARAARLRKIPVRCTEMGKGVMLGSVEFTFGRLHRVYEGQNMTGHVVSLSYPSA